VSESSNAPPKEKLQLVEPPLELRRPRSPGSGLKVAGAFVVLAVLLLWLFGGGRSPKPIHPTVQEGAAAADQLERLTKELSERAGEAKNAKMKKLAGGEDRTLTLNGVQIRVFVPPGWSISDDTRQKFLRRSGDSRICQLTADSNFDTKGRIAEIRGKEVDFEAQTMKEALGMAVPKEVRIDVGTELVLSSYTSNSVNYAVKTRMTMVVGNRSIEQSGVNSTFAAGSLMVRLQCMNMSGTGDEDNYMEMIGRSLNLHSAVGP